MFQPAWWEGVDKFLTAFCPDPTRMKAAMVDAEIAGRLDRLPDLRFLCQEGDRADCYWIVIEGTIRIEGDGTQIVLRGPGMIIGEQAFYRAARDKDGFPVRGAAMRASGDARVVKLDRAFLDGLKIEDRALWHETMARVMCAKLDEATAQRRQHRLEKLEYEGLVDRFVCADGRLAAFAALEGKGSIEPQRSHAVIWFSDVKGFSSYAAGLSPTQLGEAVNLVMEIQSEEIAKAGGQIDKYMGDGLMAFWAAPDQQRLRWNCEQATDAAVKAADRLGRQFAERKWPLDVRIGVHCGEVVFGNFGGLGRIAFTCTGKAVNEASRYEQAASGLAGERLGRVRLSKTVYAHVSNDALRAKFGGEAVEFADKHDTRFFAHTTIT